MSGQLGGYLGTDRQQRPGTETTVLPIYVFRPFFYAVFSLCLWVFLSIAEAERTLLITVRVGKKIRPAKYLLHVLLIRFYR